MGGAMGGAHGAALALVGLWLLVYPPFLRTRCRAVAERLTTLSCGLSLALLAPLLPWPPQGFRAPALALVGVTLSCCHPALTALVVSAALAAGVGGFAWQLGVCNLPQGALLDIGMSAHAILLALLQVLFIAVFVFVPGVAGPESLIFGLVPALGAVLLAVGLGGLAPAWRGLSASALLSESPCAAAASAGIASPAARSLVLAAALAGCGVALQCYMVRLMRLKAEKEGESGSGPGGDLVASLLPNAQEGAALPRPSGADSRFGLISKAIFLDEGEDLSHLTDNERKIVKICREDEFERDRLLWGGGLI